MPQFVNPPKKKEKKNETKLGLCVVCRSSAHSRLFLFIYVLLLYSLQNFWLCFLVCLAQAHALSHTHLHSLASSLSLSRSCQSVSGASSRSVRRAHFAARRLTHTTTAATNGFHFHCAAYSPTHTYKLSRTHTLRYGHLLAQQVFVLLRFSLSLAYSFCSVRFCSLFSALSLSLSDVRFCSRAVSFCAIFNFSQRKYGACSGRGSKKRVHQSSIFKTA